MRFHYYNYSWTRLPQHNRHFQWSVSYIVCLTWICTLILPLQVKMYVHFYCHRMRRAKYCFAASGLFFTFLSSFFCWILFFAEINEPHVDNHVYLLNNRRCAATTYHLYSIVVCVGCRICFYTQSKSVWMWRSAFEHFKNYNKNKIFWLCCSTNPKWKVFLNWLDVSTMELLQTRNSAKELQFSIAACTF